MSEHEQVREAIRRYNAEIAAKIELGKVEDARAEATLDEIQEELRGLAFNAGISSEDFGPLIERGNLGTEVLDVLTRGEANSVEEAVRLLYQQAGNEAGKMLVDPYSAAFDKKTMRLGQEHPLFWFIKPDLSLKRKGRKPMSKAELGKIADFQRWLHGENE